MKQERIDLLVLGGGMAGLSAGAAAARNGSRVLVVEKAARVGGSAALALGFVWTARSPTVMREVMPLGDPELGTALTEGLDPALDWVRSLGVHLGPQVTVMGYGRGRQIDMASYLSACEEGIKRAGGEIRTLTTTERLLQEDDRVTGAVIVEPGSDQRTVHAAWTLLATGGFQNGRELTAQYIHPQAAAMLRRCASTSVGDGMRLGLSAGAQVGKAGAGFYGHLVPYPVKPWGPAHFVKLSLYFSEHGLLLNQAGQRFVDETVADHLNSQAVLEQAGARALLVVDERVRRGWVTTSYHEGHQPLDKFAAIREHGGRLFVADDLNALAHLPKLWGYDAKAVVATVLGYNAAAAADRAQLLPARINDPLPLNQAPFYAVDTQPAITFTQVGLLIHTSAHVLNKGGQRIPGLLAAGADTGGTYVRGYAGGLALALVFGLKAAETVRVQAGGGGGGPRAAQRAGEK